jgi:hypothetical protein
MAAMAVGATQHMAFESAHAAGATVDTDAVANPEYHIVTLMHHEKLISFFIFYFFEFFGSVAKNPF